MYNITMDKYFIQYKSASNAHTSYCLLLKTGKINHCYNYIKTAFYSNMQLCSYLLDYREFRNENATAVATAMTIYLVVILHSTYCLYGIINIRYYYSL
jgi:hypothetical protein